MHPARWLEIAFGSESRVRILRLLLQEPRRTRTEREIASEIGMSPNAVNHAVRSLCDAGLVDVEPIGRAHAVRLANDTLVLSALERVFASEAEVWSGVLETIRSTLPSRSICYLFGSSARGTSKGDSDVDLLIIAKDKEKAVEAAYAVEVKFHEKLNARLHIIALGEREAKKRARTKGVVQSAIEAGQLLTPHGLTTG